MKLSVPNYLFFMMLAAFFNTACAKPKAELSAISLPDGFGIEVFADNVPDARSMVRSPGGVIYVGNRRGNSVFAVVVDEKTQRASEVYEIASGLNMPNGVAFSNGSLFVAEVNRILRFDDIDARLTNPPQPVVVVDDLPVEKHHGWRYIAFGPDDKLYVPIGAPCNICDEPGYALIMRMQADGSDREVVARGVRNSVGFDWRPASNELWFTDNGRDMLGDDEPPCELNRLTADGQHFGFPYCHGENIPDPEFGEQKKCSDFSPPAMALGAHVAPLGMKFYSGQMFPEEYQGQIFIAEHGSWNRSKKVGYRVTLVGLDDGKATSYTPFAEGWLQGEEATGRPVDILQMPDGALLVSDDMGGKIYRIFYEQKN